MKKIRSHFVFIYLMFFVGVILTVDLLINGRDFFLNDKGHIGVLLAIGMLTFVSIFFSLIISVKKNIQKFLIWTDVTKNLVKNLPYDKFTSVRTYKEIISYDSIALSVGSNSLFPGWSNSR